MPKGVRKPKVDYAPVTTIKSAPNIIDQIAENERQILETEKILTNLKEMKIMLHDLKDKSDLNELFTMLKSSGLSVSDFIKSNNKIEQQTEDLSRE